MKSPLTLVGVEPLPTRVTVGADLQAAAHVLHAKTGRIAGALGRNWTTEQQLAAAEAECFALVEHGLAMLRLLRERRT